MNKLILICLFGLCQLFFSCEKSVYVTPELPDTISFKRDLIPVFNSYCNNSSCHGGSFPKGNFNLEPSVAYDQIWENSMVDTLHPGKSVLYIQISSAPMIMPPSGHIDSFYVKEVLKWIQQKARNN
jgi:hypothetical protein